MRERSISRELVQELIEVGKMHKKDEKRVWIYQDFVGRDDNLICAAVVLEKKLIIKTIMHGWQLLEDEK